MNINNLIKFIREIYQSKDFIPLHSPSFSKNDENRVLETIKSTYVSSVGKYVNKFEDALCSLTGSNGAVATVNGTAALHASLEMRGITHEDYVITQALSFVATCNAILYTGAKPIFVDVSRKTLGMCPIALEKFLKFNADVVEGRCIYKKDKKIIKAVIPMHTFGHPVEIDKIAKICNDWSIDLIEDAAESLGSTYRDRHLGTFGVLGITSFNGNKIITSGAGGMIFCSSDKLQRELKHITTTSKVKHKYRFKHDMLGYNYRMPNINAALGYSQLDRINFYISNKRKLANRYSNFFEDTSINFFHEPKNAKSNYWLNTIICNDIKERDNILNITNENGVMTRPAWDQMNKLPYLKNSITDSLENTSYLIERIVNLPSNPTIDNFENIKT